MEPNHTGYRCYHTLSETFLDKHTKLTLPVGKNEGEIEGIYASLQVYFSKLEKAELNSTNVDDGGSLHTNNHF